jgi:hypothetical protein
MLFDKKICYALDVNSITTSDQIIRYRCSSPLLAYDKDAANMVYNRHILGKTNDKLDKLFKLMFIDEKVILSFDQLIKIKFVTGQIDARLTNNFNECIPNPHHYYYNCWGNYGPTITKLIHEYKLEEMFYQIKAAMGSLNFLDNPVITRFINMLEEITTGVYNPNSFYWKEENCTTLHTCEETLNHFEMEDTTNETNDSN